MVLVRHQSTSCYMYSIIAAFDRCALASGGELQLHTVMPQMLLLMVMHHGMPRSFHGNEVTVTVHGNASNVTFHGNALSVTIHGNASNVTFHGNAN